METGLVERLDSYPWSSVIERVKGRMSGNGELKRRVMLIEDKLNMSQEQT